MTENEDAYENEKDNDNDDDITSCEDTVIDSSPSESLFFVYQTQWMKHLLQRDGNEIYLLDATYKTTRYALSLFFLAVKTNVDYQVVGAFVCEDESTENILAALRILKCWIPVETLYTVWSTVAQRKLVLWRNYSQVLFIHVLSVCQIYLPFISLVNI